VIPKNSLFQVLAWKRNHLTQCSENVHLNVHSISQVQWEHGNLICTTCCSFVTILPSITFSDSNIFPFFPSGFHGNFDNPCWHVFACFWPCSRLRCRPLDTWHG
jgi:hypothetical protein